MLTINLKQISSITVSEKVKDCMFIKEKEYYINFFAHKFFYRKKYNVYTDRNKPNDVYFDIDFDSVKQLNNYFNEIDNIFDNKYDIDMHKMTISLNNIIKINMINGSYFNVYIKDDKDFNYILNNLTSNKNELFTIKKQTVC